ncbi:MAG: acyl-CoA dehydrogenase [Chitinophagaceae bacterium]
MKLSENMINEIDEKTLRSFAAAAEQNGRLCNEQLEIIYKNNWFNLFVPKEYGGLELSLTDGLKIEESLAYIEGSLGWTVTLCAGANWFVGFLNKKAALEIFSDKKVCLAGSGRPSGVAKILPGGFEITGYWKYATGAPHATVFTVNCVMEKDGLLLKDENGKPQIASFWFTKDEVSIDYDWKTMGMKATASESFSVYKLIVPANRIFHIQPTSVVLEGAIYRYPFLQFAEATLAINMSGMAMHFFDLCEFLFSEKYAEAGADASLKMKNLLDNCKQRLNNLREIFFEAIDRSWAELQRTQSVNDKDLKQISEVCKELARSARLLTEELYPHCGLTAADPTTEINRIWRDIHTASQHTLLV